MAASPLDALDSYIKSHVSEEDILAMAERSFGLQSKPDSLTEVYRAFWFLKEFDFHAFAESYWPAEARMQIKIYALKAHIDTLPLDEEATQLFKHFFEEMLPKFPTDIQGDNLGNFDVIETYGSYIYDVAIYEKRKNILQKELFPTPSMSQENPLQLTGDNWAETIEKFTTEELRALFTSSLLTKDNWKETLENSLQSNASDPIAQFLIIDAMWNNFIYIYQCQNDSIVKDFFKVLGDLAKNGVHAASNWLIAAAGHGQYFLHDGKIDPSYEQFNTEDLFLFLRNSTFVITNGAVAYVQQYLVGLMSIISKEELKEFIQSLENLDKKNIAVVELKFTLLGVVLEKKPEFRELLDPIMLDLVKFFEEIKADDFKGNPMLRNSEHLKCPPLLMDVMDKHLKGKEEARTIIAVASSRTGITHFQGMPAEEPKATDPENSTAPSFSKANP